MTDPNSAGTSERNHSRSHKDYYTALYQAALAISSSLDLDQVLQDIVKSTTEAMQVMACGLRLLNTRTRTVADCGNVWPEQRLPGKRTR